MQNPCNLIKCGLIILILWLSDSADINAAGMIIDKQNEYKPLDWIELADLQAGTVIVLDGKGNEYLREAVSGKLKFRIGGFLGSHSILHLDKKKQIAGH